MSRQDDVAIEVEDVTKSFRLPHEKQNSIKGLFLNMFRGGRIYEKQQVLNNVSFEVKKGEFFGIVGRNGSGKSTLLKLLSGIYTPDSGSIKINGKLTPFIELGVGFNPELTGRENVFLNGALLGFNRDDMSSMYDEIVEFAGLEKFMDQKLKNYSSGMQVRLAFSIAVRANTEILILDEVLAVGDSNFQQKCMQYFRQFKQEGRTIVLVTHSMEQVEKFCDRALLIADGDVLKIGDPRDIAFEYVKKNNESVESKSSAKDTGSKDVVIDKVLINHKNGIYETGSLLEIKANYLKKNNSPKSMYAAVGIYHEDGAYLVGVDMKSDQLAPVKVLKKGSIMIRFGTIPLLSGEYTVNMALFEEDRESPLHYIRDVAKFRVIDPLNRRGLVSVNHEWRENE